MYGEDKNGVSRPPLIDPDRRLVVASGGGELTQAALDGRLFHAANQTNVTTTAELQVVWTGLGIGNPSASGKNYIMHEFSWGQEIIMNTEGVVGVMIATIGNMAQDIVPVCGLIGADLSSAFVSEGATIASPVFLKAAGSSMEGTIATVPSLGPNVLDIKGGIILPPGYALLSYTFAVQTTSIQFGFVWEERDV